MFLSDNIPNWWGCYHRLLHLLIVQLVSVFCCSFVKTIKLTNLEYWPSLFDYLNTEGQYGGYLKLGVLPAAYEPLGNDDSMCLLTITIPSALEKCYDGSMQRRPTANNPCKRWRHPKFAAEIWWLLQSSYNIP